MTDYEKKEDKVLDKIVDEIVRLDATLEKLDETNNRATAWVEQKRAMHEIKKILHEADKYDKYNEEEWMDFIESLDD
jgi:hypothetical protein